MSTASIQDAVAVAVTKGVLSMLDRSTLPQIYSFTPERSYADWDLELKDFDKLRVDVVCNSTAQVPGLESRGKVYRPDQVNYTKWHTQTAGFVPDEVFCLCADAEIRIDGFNWGPDET